MSEADGLLAKLVAHEGVAGVRSVALVENQIDHGEHGRQTRRQLGPFGHLVGKFAIADRPLGTHEPLGDRGLGHEKGSRDLRRREASYQPERERDAAVGWQTRMTAGKDQPESVVRDLRGIGHLEALVHRAERGLVGERISARPRTAGVTEAIQRASPCRREEPGAWALRRAVRGPAIERLRERLLDDLLRGVDVAHDPEHGRDDAPDIDTAEEVVQEAFAVSMSRTIRSTDATTRPYSRRNASATRDCTPPSDICPRSFDPTDRHDTRRPSGGG